MRAQKTVEDNGYCVPKIFLLYSLGFCEKQLAEYQRIVKEYPFPDYTEHYIPWLTQRIKYLKAKELING